jgi:hypothetical protein
LTQIRALAISFRIAVFAAEAEKSLLWGFRTSQRLASALALEKGIIVCDGDPLQRSIQKQK